MEGSPRAEPLSCSHLFGGETEAQGREGIQADLPAIRLALSLDPAEKRAPGTCLGLLLCLRKKAAEELGLRPDGGQPGHLECRELGQVSRSQVSCWEKQPFLSQQVAWRGKLVPEKICPLPAGLPQGRAGRLGLPRSPGSRP